MQSVRPGSPALAAGVKPLDVVVKVNNRPTPNYADLVSMLKSMKGGQEVVLSIKRQDSELSVKVKLGNPR